MNKVEAVTIDGPAAAGKSTIAKAVAQKLNYIYIDTGAMYRAMTLIALENKIDMHNETELFALLKQTDITLTQNDEDGQKIIMNGRDVTDAVRSDNVTQYVSLIATYPKIRKEMVKRQRKLAEHTGIVMDGRDIGTHVLPEAPYKFYLTASVEERANRRYKENHKKGFKSNLATIKHDISNRDRQDREREIAPLIKAENAMAIDTTSLSIQEVINLILNTISETPK